MLSEQEFIKLYKHPRGRSSFEETFLKRLYPQVLPHLKGEFPRKAIEAVGQHLWHKRAKSDGTEKDRWVKYFVDAVEHALSGGYKVCPTCGGSGEVLCTKCKGHGVEIHTTPCYGCTDNLVGGQKVYKRSYSGRFADEREEQRRKGEEKTWPPGYGRRVKGSDMDRRFKTSRRGADLCKKGRRLRAMYPYSSCEYFPMGRRKSGKSRRKGVHCRRTGSERRG